MDKVVPVSRAEEIASCCARTMLAPLTPGDAVHDSEALREFQSALEYVLPALLADTLAWWRNESLDGFQFSVARMIERGAAEFIGLCLLITDQSWTPIHLRLRVADERDVLDGVDLKLGEVGDGAGGMVRTPWGSAHVAQLADGVAARLGSISWAYEIKRGAELGHLTSSCS